MKAVDETPIVERYKVDWAMLSEPYVRPNTLNWAIERDKNMQRFAHTLIEELSASEQRERVLREALDAPITIADLKREGIQGLCAVSAIRAVNAIMLRRAALATPAPEQPTPKEPQI